MTNWQTALTTVGLTLLSLLLWELFLRGIVKGFIPGKTEDEPTAV